MPISLCYAEPMLQGPYSQTLLTQWLKTTSSLKRDHSNGAVSRAAADDKGPAPPLPAINDPNVLFVFTMKWIKYSDTAAEKAMVLEVGAAGHVYEVHFLLPPGTKRNGEQESDYRAVALFTSDTKTVQSFVKDRPAQAVPRPMNNPRPVGPPPQRMAPPPPPQPLGNDNYANVPVQLQQRPAPPPPGNAIYANIPKKLPIYAPIPKRM